MNMSPRFEKYSIARNLKLAAVGLATIMLLVLTLPRSQFVDRVNQVGLHEKLVLSGPTQGTSYVITIYGIPPHLSETEIVRIVESELNSIDRLVSNWNPHSEISLFNAFGESNWFSISEETGQVVTAGLKASQESNGAFDMTVKPLVKLWGFGVASSESGLPTASQIAAAQSQVGWQKIEIRDDSLAIRKANPEMQMDLSGIAQGYSVDRIAQQLEQAGVTTFLVEIGGEAVSRGKKPDGTSWRVGIERPNLMLPTHDAIQSVIRLENQAVATSGDYRQFRVVDGERYSHIIDPRTGRPIRHSLASATVIANSCMEADALSTALMVMGETDGYAWAEKQQMAAMFISRQHDDYSVRYTKRFLALLDPSVPELP